MKLSELRGTRIKKDFNALRVRKTFENKHKDHSGNFGFVLVLKDDSPNRLLKEKWFAFNGHYNTNGNIIILQCGDYASLGTTHRIEPITYENFLKIMKEVIKQFS